MNAKGTLSPDERRAEELLSALSPAGHAIDRDRLLFEAGRASVRRRRWVWPGVSVALLAALVVSLAVRPEPRTIERTVRVVEVRRPAEHPAPAPSLASASVGGGGGDIAGLVAYVQLQRDVLEHGLDVLPKPRYSNTTTSASETPSVESLLGMPRRRTPGGPFSFLVGGNS